MMRILAVAGSSGGHIFPAIGFLDECTAAHPDAKTMLVVPARSVAGRIPCGAHALCRISAEALSARPGRASLISLWAFIKSFVESIAFLSRFKPDIVVGFGSIASIPVVLCAWLFRITVVIHEQNVLPGRANRFLAHVSGRIAVSFRKSADFFAGNRTKVVWTGNIIRRSLVMIDRRDARMYFKLDPDKRTILVMGGSQASRRINAGFVEAFRVLPHRRRYQVIHLCGEADKDDLEKAYAGCEAEVRLITFLNEMQYAYSASDLAISRAGATTVAELTAYRLPAILIPYPYARRHQDENARVLAQAGCAVVVADEQIDSGVLSRALEAATATETAAESMRAAYDRVNNGTPASLVDTVFQVHHHG